MPKTKFQELIYGVLMTFFMVIAMELYNAGLRDGGLTYSALPNALSDPMLCQRCVLCFPSALSWAFSSSTAWFLRLLLKWRFRERIMPCWSLP